MLPTEPWSLIRSSTLLIDCLVKTGTLSPYSVDVSVCLSKILDELENLNTSDDEELYEKSLLVSNLLMICTKSNNDLLIEVISNRKVNVIKSAIEEAKEINTLFYKGRSTGILYSTLLTIGYKKELFCNNKDLLKEVLDYVYDEIEYPALDEGDEIHSSSDYVIFPLLLIFNAISLSKDDRYFTYKKDWTKYIYSVFHSLSYQSKTSQLLFYLLSFNGLEDPNYPVIKPSELFLDVQLEYVNSMKGSEFGDYLRCCYLVVIARGLNLENSIHPKVWNILNRNIDDMANLTYTEKKSSYDSSYMKIAYIIHAFNAIGNFNILTEMNENFKIALHHLVNEEKKSDGYKLYFSLIDVALGLIPINHNNRSE